jgi:tetratricopeptide (TPR) repeat protein
VLAVLSKASAVMLPVVLGLAWWWRGGWGLRQVRWLLPFLLVSIAASGWTIWEQKVNSMASGPDWHLSLAQRAVLAGRVVWFYLGKLAWPEPLVFIYPRWEIDAGHWSWWLPAAALVAAAGWLTGRRGGPLRAWFFAGAYFVISLFPVLGFFDVFFFRYSYVADHFQHLASIGPLALAGSGLALLGRRLTNASGAVELLPALVPLGGLALLSWQQTALYRDSMTLWRETTHQNPRAWISRVNLGFQLTTVGRFEEAIAHYRAALELRPGAPEILTNLGGALLQLGRAAEAVPVLEAAVRGNPRMHEAQNALGLALIGTGRRADGRRAYEAALALKPDFVPALYNLAAVFQQEGRADEARPLLEQALRWARDPNSRFAAQRQLGEVLLGLGRPAEAAAALAGALQLKPDQIELREMLALACFQSGDWAEAARQFSQVVASRPDSPEAHNNLGSALVQLGRPAEAVPHFQEALRRQPGFLDARANLAVAYARLGRLSEAQAECELVLRARPDHPVAVRLRAETGQPSPP